MGIPLPKNEAGDTCSICWGLDKPFGEGPTPKFIRAKFSGVKKCIDAYSWVGDPPDGEYLLEQGLNECAYYSSDPDVNISFVWNNYGTSCIATVSGLIFFSSGPAILCCREFSNGLTSPVMGYPTCGYDGELSILWDEEGL